MQEKFYNVEEVSKLIDMHPKTIQRYIREGKIKATKLGKSWRISASDLNEFMNISDTQPKKPITKSSKDSKINISSVVDIDVESIDEAINISNMITASVNSKPSDLGKSSVSVQILESENKVRIMLWGGIEFTETVLYMLKNYTHGHF